VVYVDNPNNIYTAIPGEAQVITCARPYPWLAASALRVVSVHCRQDLHISRRDQSRTGRGVGDKFYVLLVDAESDNFAPR